MLDLGRRMSRMETQDQPPQLRTEFDLDQMLDISGACVWLKMGRRQLLAKCVGRKPIIPVFRLSERSMRFHPRTIIAKLAADAGVSPEIIAASLNMPTGSVDTIQSRDDTPTLPIKV